MKAVLNMIDDIEKNGVSAEVIEVQRSLQIAMDCSFFNEEWWVASAGRLPAVRAFHVIK